MSFVVEPVTSSSAVKEWRQLNSTSINCSSSDVYRFSQNFMFYGLSIIVPFGLLCNSLSLIVFMTCPMRRRASSWYLAALSLSDSTSLLAIALDYWLKNDRVGLQWMRTSELTCIVVTHLSYTSRLLSAWLVTTFTVERFIGVVYPLQRSSLISIPLARRVIGCEALGCVLLSSFTLFTIGLVQDDHSPSHFECDVRRERTQSYLICNVLFLIFGSIVIPILTIVTLNLAILKRFFVQDQNLTSTELSHRQRHHHKDLLTSGQKQSDVYHLQQKNNGHSQIFHLHLAYDRQQHTSSLLPADLSAAPSLPPPPPPPHHHHHHSPLPPLSASPPTLHTLHSLAPPHPVTPSHSLVSPHPPTSPRLSTPPHPPTPLHPLARPHPPTSPHPHCHLHHHSSSHSLASVRRDITTVLIAVSATFVILNVPYCICWFSAFFLLNFRRIDLDLSCDDHVTKLTLYAAKYISSVPYFLNYGLNFVLYSLCARSFRAQLWRTVTCKVKSRLRPPSHCIHHHPDSKMNGAARAEKDVETSFDRDLVHG